MSWTRPCLGKACFKTPPKSHVGCNSCLVVDQSFMLDTSHVLSWTKVLCWSQIMSCCGPKFYVGHKPCLVVDQSFYVGCKPCLEPILGVELLLANPRLTNDASFFLLPI